MLAMKTITGFCISLLSPDTIVEQREGGVFFIKPFTTQNVFTDEELFELLGMAQP